MCGIVYWVTLRNICSCTAAPECCSAQQPCLGRAYWSALRISSEQKQHPQENLVSRYKVSSIASYNVFCGHRIQGHLQLLLGPCHPEPDNALRLSLSLIMPLLICLRGPAAFLTQAFCIMHAPTPTCTTRNAVFAFAYPVTRAQPQPIQRGQRTALTHVATLHASTPAATWLDARATPLLCPAHQQSVPRSTSLMQPLSLPDDVHNSHPA